MPLHHAAVGAWVPDADCRPEYYARCCWRPPSTLGLSMESETVAVARLHVIQGRRIVTEQRQRVRALASHGQRTGRAEHLLQVFESTLAIFEQHLRELTK